MKIKVKQMDYDLVKALPETKREAPKPPKFLFQMLIRAVSAPELRTVKFSSKKIGMERLEKQEPCLVLMNHSSFLDLKIAFKLLFPRKFNIVCTSDGFVGKNKLMRSVGCIPTQKFVVDLALVKDMVTLTKKYRSSILMFPEASYSFDGTATKLPESLGKLVTYLDIPVVMIRTFGAFGRDPLYNGLQTRRISVSAEMEYLLSPEDIRRLGAAEIQEILNRQFCYDHFRWQQENQVKIDEPFRADGLHRVLYKCPHCEGETGMVGKGTEITCRLCGNTYELTELGYLEHRRGDEKQAGDGEGNGNDLDKRKFHHIPDWCVWQRECIRRELADGTYALDLPVDIYMLKDAECIYQVGSGRLLHDARGFVLDGCDGRLHYEQKPLASYSLYSDFFWYEIGDMICIGDRKVLYYCFPQNGENIAAKARMATEILYEVASAKKKDGSRLKR